MLDLHGQHAHQSLLDVGAQRRALDAFAGTDLGPLEAARLARRRLLDELGALGGDERARAREIDLLRYQLHEIDDAALAGPDEDAELGAEEDRLAQAAAHRDAAGRALAALDAGDTDDGAGTRRGGGGPGAVVDLLGTAQAALETSTPLAALAARLAGLQADAADAASELRHVVETWEDDPEGLARVRERRQLLRELSRKYGDGTAGVLAFAAEARARLAELEATGERAAALAAELEVVEGDLARAEAGVADSRRAAAPALAASVQERLRELAMPHARLEVAVEGPGPADEVTFLLGANPGELVLPLGKVASGGELARAMLALRLVLTDAPPTMVFDEVDAGVGGEAAQAVGNALAEVARRHQVLVVTHLAQVASCRGGADGGAQGGHEGQDGGARHPAGGRGAGGRAGPHAVGEPGVGHGASPRQGAPARHERG